MITTTVFTLYHVYHVIITRKGIEIFKVGLPFKFKFTEIKSEKSEVYLIITLFPLISVAANFIFLSPDMIDFVLN